MKRALVLTAKDTETDAVKKYLSIVPFRSVRTRKGNRVIVWRPADPESFKSDFEIALYETGKGQSEAIMHTGPVVEAFDPDIIIYLGCAGGEAPHVSIGDVLIATSVWNYEASSVKKGSAKFKGYPLKPDRILLDEAKAVDEYGVWRHRIKEKSSNSASVVFGEIASGEKVIKSTESQIWKLIKSKLSDNIIGCETEGHGFLSALAPHKKYGMMIRGVSDLIDGKGASGKQIDDLNQTNAVSHAVAFALQIIDDLDLSILRNSSTTVDSGGEVLALRIEARREDLAPIIARLSEIALALDLKVLSAGLGSLLLSVSMSARSVALCNALYEGRQFSKLLQFDVISLVPTVTVSGDPTFDSWLAEVRSGTFNGRASYKLRDMDQKWGEHAWFLSRERDRINKKSRPERPPSEPKFRNPDDPSKTWTGRGRRPYWINEYLSKGMSLEDIMIN